MDSSGFDQDALKAFAFQMIADKLPWDYIEKLHLDLGLVSLSASLADGKENGAHAKPTKGAGDAVSFLANLGLRFSLEFFLSLLLSVNCLSRQGANSRPAGDLETRVITTKLPLPC